VKVVILKIESDDTLDIAEALYLAADEIVAGIPRGLFWEIKEEE
jgi:hypothetical protein